MGKWGFFSGILNAVWYVSAIAFSVIFLVAYLGFDFWSSEFDKSFEGWETYWSETHPWSSLARGIIINLLSASLAYVCVKAIYDYVQRKRGEEEHAKFFEDMGNLFTSRVEDLLSIRAVQYFENSYYDIDWKDLLTGSESAQIAAAYWSTEWLRTNLNDLSDVSRSTKLTVYLTHPHQASDAYGATVTRQAQTRTKILDCALEFANSNIDVRFLDKIPSYMYCATQSKGSKMFIFSPYQMGDQSQHGRSPVIGLNLGSAGDKVMSFVDGEISALDSSTPLQTLNLDEHLHWSEDESRVVVSMRLSCDLGCQFCYVPSLQDATTESAYRDRELFGYALAQALVKDKKFVSGIHGSKVLIGGMTDPFLPKNSRTMAAFLEQLRHTEPQNPVHVATRLAPKAAVTEALLNHPNVAVSTSVAHFDEDVATDPASRNLQARLQKLSSLKDADVDLSIYLRPLVPDVTESALPQIVKAAKECGISKIVLGNLYVDPNILKRSKLPSDLNNKNKVLDKRMIVDPGGKLKKVDQEELRQRIRGKLEAEGFEVYGSSGEYIDAIMDGS